MSAERARLLDRLRGRLVAEAQPAGWGYHAGKSPRVESTCWALLALLPGLDEASTTKQELIRTVGSWFSRLQREHGLLAETEPSLANLAANGLASIALGHGRISDVEVQSGLIRGLTRVKGVRLRESDPKQDNTLQAWPWVQDTFSWVEPTSWCLLALKKVTTTRDRTVAARIEEAERYLIDRVCSEGGWNYGNASTLGQDLRSYVPTTAMALLALQDRRDHPAVTRSLAVLQQNRLSERATMSLALASMALRLFSVDCEDVDAQMAISVERSERLGHLQAIAMALYALSAETHALEALRV